MMPDLGDVIPGAQRMVPQPLHPTEFIDRALAENRPELDEPMTMFGISPYELVPEKSLNWAIEWVRGMAEKLSKGPPTKTRRQFLKDTKTIMDIGLQPGADIYKISTERWFKNLKEAVST